jgi:hypothetical protein
MAEGWDTLTSARRRHIEGGPQRMLPQIIVIATVSHGQQRYPTLGDWYPGEDGALNIVISSLPGPSALAVAIHELVEAVLCNWDSITAEEVDTFDMEHLAGGEIGEPGDHPEAPYREQHKVATRIERAVVEALGIPWREHERMCELVERSQSP